MAFDVLQAVATSDAYANLLLPRLLTERAIRGRDAAFATELVYGTLRLRGRYDAVLALTSSRPLAQLEPAVLDLLRLGTHQVLGMRVPPHAAVSETVALARAVAGPARSSFVNAVLRAVGARDLEGWLAELRAGPDPLAAELSHPTWVIRAMRESLVANGRPVDELPELLAADNQPPEVTLVARPGLVTVDELAQEAAAARFPVTGPGRLAGTALRLAGGDPGALPAVRDGRAGVQDEGSQLVALAAALAALPRGGAALAGGASPRWLDLCAGPGGKTALLAAVLAGAAGSGAELVANELSAHRADLVRQAVRAVGRRVAVEVRQGDGREVGAAEPAAYDLVLVDAPCTGLGALRRRPEARWRRRPEDLAQLTVLQRDLLRSAVAATAPGGVVAYVTCSPHLAETHAVAADLLRHTDLEVLDAPAALRAAASTDVPDLGPGPFAQLWPHRHGTDAMFLALARRRS